MPNLTVNGADLDFTDVGSGKPVVLIHGSAADRRVWSDTAAPLSESHRVITYSRRYHWPNRKIIAGADYSMAEHVNDLLSLVDNLDLEEAVLVGHSYGGLVALLAAMADMTRFDRLVLIEPPVIPLLIDDPPRPIQLIRLLARNPAAAQTVVRFGISTVNPARRAAEDGDLEAAVRIFGKGVLGENRFEQLSNEQLGQILDNYTLAEFTGSGFPPMQPEEIADVRIPTLLINGGDSPRLFHHLNAALARVLPNVERSQVLEASHNIPEDAPQSLARMILEFTAAPN